MGFQAVIKSAASAASLGTQKITKKLRKNEGIIVFLAFYIRIMLTKARQGVHRKSDTASQQPKKTSPDTQKTSPDTHKTIPSTQLTILGTQLTHPGTRPQKKLETRIQSPVLYLGKILVEYALCERSAL